MKSPMENRSENRHETDGRMSLGHLADGAGASPAPSQARVAEVASPNAISLPIWFDSAKACSVLRLKARSFVLLSDARGVRRVASLARLAAAPADRGLVASSVPLGPAVTPVTPLSQALRLMDTHAADHAAVVVGGVVVGILSREVAVRAIVQAPASSRAAAAHPTAAPDDLRVERLAA